MRIGNEGTPPDDILLGFWNKLVELERVKTFFYDGRVQDAGEFITFMKGPSIFPLLVISADGARFLALAWLERFINAIAISRFCYLDNPQKEIGQQILDYWNKIELLKVIIGITPESHKSTVKMIKHLGFHVIGKIPDACNLCYEDRREAGIISYYLIGEKGNGGQKQNQRIDTN